MKYPFKDQPLCSYFVKILINICFKSIFGFNISGLLDGIIFNLWIFIDDILHVYQYLSINTSIYVSIYQSIHLSIYLCLGPPYYTVIPCFNFSSALSFNSSSYRYIYRYKYIEINIGIHRYIYRYKYIDINIGIHRYVYIDINT